MEIIHLRDGMRIEKPKSVALGNFDGVHLGHKALLDEVCSGHGQGYAGCVWTFSHHTLSYFRPEGIAQITTLEYKSRLFEKNGIEYTVYDDFERVRDMSASRFVDEVLLYQLSCRMAVCGFHFRFGRRGEGDAALLRSLLEKKGVECRVIPPVMLDGELVSSSHIRRLISVGDMEGAARFLGRPFAICLPVVQGYKLGRTIGFPTINQNFPPEHIIPAGGIYACRCIVDGKEYDGVSNIGYRPTVSGDSLNCETHIMGFSGDLYGDSIEVSFYKRLRGERKFDSVEELKEQIALDVVQAVEYFSNRKW
ncbi:MAG: bifunctional riboflavin kinase/FAD synthetase [Eubacteriales bacterium]